MTITYYNWNTLYKGEYNLIMPLALFKKLKKYDKNKFNMFLSCTYCRLTIRDNILVDWGDQGISYYEEDYPASDPSNIWVTSIVTTRTIYTKL